MLFKLQCCIGRCAVTACYGCAAILYIFTFTAIIKTEVNVAFPAKNISSRRNFQSVPDRTASGYSVDFSERLMSLLGSQTSSVWLCLYIVFKTKKYVYC